MAVEGMEEVGRSRRSGVEYGNIAAFCMHDGTVKCWLSWPLEILRALWICQTGLGIGSAQVR